MPEHINYDSLLVLTIVAFFTPFLVNKLKKIKIPYQVGEIFVGIIVGKSFLNIIKPDSSITLLAEIGLAYLMFLSGLEIDFKSNSNTSNENKGGWKLKVSIFMFLMSIIISFLIVKFSPWLGLNKGIAFFTLLFAASAPGLLVPFLKEIEILDSDYGQTLLIYSLICEFVCLIGLSFISSTTLYGLSYKNFLFLLLILVAILIYFIANKAYKRHSISILALKNLHISVRAAFALILILVTLSDKIRSEIALGSFLAGMIFSLILGEAKKEVSHQFDVIGYGFLIPIFFIMVGVRLDLHSILENPNAIIKIPIFLLIFFIVKLIPCILLKRKYGTNKALSASIILSSQLSIIIVGAQMALNLKLIDMANYSAFIITTVLSCILFPVLFNKFFKEDTNLKSKTDIGDKIIIREAIVSNELYFNKSLKDISFPNSCRVFLINRNNIELMPFADTKIKKDDILFLAGLKDGVEESIKMLNIFKS